MSATIINPHNGRGVSSIDLGSRVVVKGDLNSPVMTCMMPVTTQNQNEIVGWICGWFNETFSPGPDGIYASAKQYNQAQFLIGVLEAAQEDIQ
jgi:hypothetical protein